MTTNASSGFPIPSSLQDLERAPYNLLPYPVDFADDDEAERAESFDRLVHLIEQSNRTLTNGGLSLFEPNLDEEEEWMDEERVQALYTLVRKSSSLAPATRARLVATLCQAVRALSSILSAADGSEEESSEGVTDQSKQTVMSQSFRDAFACHLYMLFSVMFFTESEAKVEKSLNGKTPSKTKRNEKNNDSSDVLASRAACAQAMLAAAQSMGKHRSRLWKRGVPDEAVVGLPCRIAYQMLESATGVVARKASFADEALGMIAATVDSAECLLGTIVAALVDLLHSFEHMAPLVAELCCMTDDSNERLAVELLREIGRLDPSSGATVHDTGGKASGVKNVAPFISEIAAVRPRIVLANITLLLPHLHSEPYVIRSAIATAIGHILEAISKTENSEGGEGENTENERSVHLPGKKGNLRSRDSLFDILAERVHDVSSFTRSTVLKVFISLTQNGSVPLERVRPITALAIDRLQDKTVMVRRGAMQLLTSLLENNPFMGCLDPGPYRRKLTEHYQYIKAHLPPDIKEAYEAAVEEAGEDVDSETLHQIEHAALIAAVDDGDSLTNSSDELTRAEEEYRSKVQAIKFSQSALDFIEQFETANQTFQGMLLSATTSDVTEALRFFVRANHFELPCAITGMKNALPLMWSTEPSIKEEVLKAFVEVFIAVPGTDGKEPLPDNKIAHNLLVLAGRASVSELASIEEALGLVVENEGIPVEVFLILWSIASKASGEARAAAMLVLSLAASADPSIVDSASRMRLLLEAGLGEYTEQHRDWRTACSAACALQRVQRVQNDAAPAKLIVLDQIIERLCVVTRGDWCLDDCKKDTQMWFSAAEQAIHALFNVCLDPEIACAEIIRGMKNATFRQDDDKSYVSCHSLRLSRFFFVLGHIAVKLLVYTESVSGLVRRANANKSLKRQETADMEKSQKRASLCDPSGDEEDMIEAELGIAAEMEAENERNIADISENEIVGRGLIGLFGPLLVRIVGNEGGLFSCELLMQSSTLALCKLMCISSTFCEQHLPLLFTALANAPTQDETLRANTVVALGDLAFRFPNEVEPYTSHLYACLRHRSTKVRRHTLMVLTHLILNDMVKVKGQVCEIAMCLQDDDQRIRDMSRLLFHELSKRSNNPIYNLLPDIISQLSQMSIRKEHFRSIMSFLLSFIKKERQNEMLVEKLCHRMPNCTSISQKADIAFCIAQLRMNERSIKCLNNLFKFYKDSLFDDDVKKSFFSIVTRAKKFMKPEMKECLEEWEARLNEHAQLGMENELAGKKAGRAKAKAAKKAAKSKKQQDEWNSETEEEESVVSSDENIASSEDMYCDKENIRTPMLEAVKSARKKKPSRRSRGTLTPGGI